MIKPMWKLISLILALGVFLVVGIANLTSSEELIWTVGKSIAAFFVSWIILNHLGAMLLAILEKPDDAAAPSEAASTGERGS
jgi:hypothetical protein